MPTEQAAAPPAAPSAAASRSQQPPSAQAGEPAASAASPSSPASPASEDREPGFDQVLDRLRVVVNRLEQGNLSLEQALLAFEEGVRLSRRGSAILDAAEQRVELLVRDEDGSERRQPLPAQSAQAVQAEKTAAG